ncbi:MAG: ABC transporter ATP-binding protein [Thermoplasmatota archaeon]
MDSIITTRGLTKIFGSHAAVAGVDLDIGRGEVFGLLGPNGAGKTTFIRMLATLLEPTSGSAVVAGDDVRTSPSLVRRHVGIVFQETSLDTLLTGRENLALHARLYGVRKEDRARRIREMLQLVGLEDRADEIVRNYSGGMRRRLEIARGLLHEPEVLFLDEPTLGLDVQTREVIWDYIRKLAGDYGTTVVLTTHYMDEADSLCHRIGIIDRGKIVALGSPRTLKAAIGGDRVRLRTTSTAREALAKLPFVKNVETKGPDLVLTVEDSPHHLAEVVQVAGKVDEIEVHTPTLEDVFIHHTGHAIRDEEGDGEDWVSMRMRTEQRGH